MRRIKSILTTSRSLTILVVALLLSLSEVSATVAVQGNTSKPKASIRARVKRADRQFVRGEQQNAMANYAKAFEKLDDNSTYKQELAFKAARLSVLCQNHNDVLKYYNFLYELDHQVLSADDVFYYINAHRAVGNEREAEVLCREYAFDPNYSNDSRYINLLQSLSANRHYFKAGEDAHLLRYMPFNTENAEYYVASYRDSLFFVSSQSYMKDPNKVFYHQNAYITLTQGKTRRPFYFDYIPEELQKGTVTYNSDSTLVVTTVNVYNGMESISIEEGANLYSTKLYFSKFDDKKKRWGAFKPLYPEVLENRFSYAHPQFVEGGNTIIFTSDMGGGFGGMDLYIARRAEDGTWMQPENMGKVVNTSANEIFPILNGNRLTFSSNGHVGGGGYDLYDVIFENGAPIVGSLYHHQYPVNTSFNDFMYYSNGDQTYIASDRAGNDDIYQIFPRVTSITSEEASELQITNKNASLGHSDAIAGFLKDYSGERTADVDWNSESLRGGKVLLSIYFDFDVTELDSKMKRDIRRAIASLNLTSHDHLEIVGYADEIGADLYNTPLSLRRAQNVEQYIGTIEDEATMSSEGRGEFHIAAPVNTSDDQNVMIGETQTPSHFNSLINMYREARRVDIILQKN